MVRNLLYMGLNTISNTLDDYAIESDHSFLEAGIFEPNLCFRKIIFFVIFPCIERTRDFRQEDSSEIPFSLS